MSRQKRPLTDIEREQVKHLYLNEYLSTYNIGKKLHRTPSTIALFLRRIGVMRSIGEANKVALRLGRKVLPSQKGRLGELSPSWKGGRCRRSDGYISILCRNHPRADSGGRVLEHRLVVEKYLGRYLSPSEIVHHKNGIRDDNRIENLRLIQGKKEHSRIHPNVVCPYCGKHFILTNAHPIDSFI